MVFPRYLHAQLNDLFEALVVEGLHHGLIREGRAASDVRVYKLNDADMGRFNTAYPTLLVVKRGDDDVAITHEFATNQVSPEFKLAYESATDREPRMSGNPGEHSDPDNVVLVRVAAAPSETERAAAISRGLDAPLTHAYSKVRRCDASNTPRHLRSSMLIPVDLPGPSVRKVLFAMGEKFGSERLQAELSDYKQLLAAYDASLGERREQAIVEVQALSASEIRALFGEITECTVDKVFDESSEQVTRGETELGILGLLEVARLASIRFHAGLFTPSPFAYSQEAWDVAENDLSDHPRKRQALQEACCELMMTQVREWGVTAGSYEDGIEIMRKIVRTAVRSGNPERIVKGLNRATTLVPYSVPDEVRNTVAADALVDDVNTLVTKLATEERSETNDILRDLQVRIRTTLSGTRTSISGERLPKGATRVDNAASDSGEVLDGHGAVGEAPELPKDDGLPPLDL